MSIEERFKTLRLTQESNLDARRQEIAKLDEQAELLRCSVFDALQEEIGFLNDLNLSVRRTSQWIFIDHIAHPKLVSIYPDLCEKRWSIEPKLVGSPIQLTVDACLENIAATVEHLDRKLHLRTFRGE